MKIRSMSLDILAVIPLSSTVTLVHFGFLRGRGGLTQSSPVSGAHVLMEQLKVVLVSSRRMQLSLSHWPSSPLFTVWVTLHVHTATRVR